MWPGHRGCTEMSGAGQRLSASQTRSPVAPSPAPEQHFWWKPAWQGRKCSAALWGPPCPPPLSLERLGSHCASITLWPLIPQALQEGLEFRPGRDGPGQPAHLSYASGLAGPKAFCPALTQAGPVQWETHPEAAGPLYSESG